MNRLYITLLATICISLTSLSGCFKDPNPAPPPQQPKEGIIGKTTTDIGEFDPNQHKPADLAVDTSRPLHAMTAGSYQYSAAELAKINIKKAVEIFNALEGRYPKDHQEFMERIIKENGIELPVISTKHRYLYDVEKHELVIVEVE